MEFETDFWDWFILGIGFWDWFLELVLQLVLEWVIIFLDVEDDSKRIKSSTDYNRTTSTYCNKMASNPLRLIEIVWV